MHMAGVLGIMLRKVEQNTTSGALQNGVKSGSGRASVDSATSSQKAGRGTHIPKSNGSGSAGSGLLDREPVSPMMPYSPTFSTSSSSHRAITRFEGPHLFAGHKGATVFSSSTTASPHLSASTRSNPDLVVKPSASHPNGTGALGLSRASTVLPYTASSPLSRSHSSTDRVHELTTMLEESKSRLSEHQSTIDSMAQEKAVLASKLEELEGSLQESLAKSHQVSEARSQATSAENDELRRQLSTLQVELEQSIKDASVWETQARQASDSAVSSESRLVRQVHITLARHKAGESILSRILPDQGRIGDFGLTEFLDRSGEGSLEGILSGVSQAHAEVERENERLRGQLEESSQREDSERSGVAAENAKLREQVERLEREKVALASNGVKLESQLADQQNEAIASRQEVARLTASLQTLQKSEQAASTEKTQLLARAKQAEQEGDAVRRRLEQLTSDLDKARQSSEAAEGKILAMLLPLWKALPSEQILASRRALQEADEVAKYKQAFDATASGNTSPFSMPDFVRRVEDSLSSSSSLLARLTSIEANATMHKAASLRAERLLQESSASMQKYYVQTAELEERIEVSSKQEVQMLERLNDLQDALENSRQAARRAEGNAKDLERRCSALQREKFEMQNRKEGKGAIEKLERECKNAREEAATVSIYCSCGHRKLWRLSTSGPPIRHRTSLTSCATRSRASGSKCSMSLLHSRKKRALSGLSCVLLSGSSRPQVCSSGTFADARHRQPRCTLLVRSVDVIARVSPPQSRRGMHPLSFA